MFIKTHLTITIFGILVLINLVNGFENKFIFIFVALIATFIPDVDTKFSKLGKRKVFRPLQFFFSHRGPIHSFSFLILICVLLFFWKPVIAFGFLIGYGLHLFADCFTKIGIYPFWPLKRRCKGFVKTGGRIETFIFALFLVLDLVLFGLKVFADF